MAKTKTRKKKATKKRKAAKKKRQGGYKNRIPITAKTRNEFAVQHQRLTARNREIRCACLLR